MPPSPGDPLFLCSSALSQVVPHPTSLRDNVTGGLSAVVSLGLPSAFFLCFLLAKSSVVVIATSVQLSL